MLVIDKLREYVRENRDDIVGDLRSLIKHPSVSAQGIGIDECAGVLNGIMRDAGLESRIIRLEEGNPVVYGEAKGESDRTLLFYGHYDVQPAEPLDAWRYNPFSGIVTDDKVHGRGAADSKGNVIALVKAVKAMLDMNGTLPLNVKVLIEGEEEVSSVHLPGFVKEHADMLKADACVCFDGSLNPSGSPNIYAGLKGLLYVEFRVRTASVDMHSSLAPIAPNAAWTLTRLLNSIRRDGRIMVKGWYDDVRVPTKDDLTLLESLEYDVESIKKDYGVREFIGKVKGKVALKRLLFEPTCNIAGIYSGYVASGSKTVLPSEALAKVDFRLVYDQRPEELFRRLQDHISSLGFTDVEVTMLGSLEPSKTNPNARIVKAVASAASSVYSRKPSIFPNSWASGPDYVFTKILKMNSVWTGCSPAHANIHAPNEFTSVRNVLDGICYVSSMMQEFAR
ncbi:MAG: M20/M25/M40 family metallo-hydrolase [Candidatus Nitrosocaldus sp.]|nr:M20/M25/M40 family metallo-hydrolase [Candidatus Nitrosocaldus sp.]MCS7140975.1 M20/M25/M40 family metallo-hydrolase [Candidatus Nitrosocaldus sp.]MDW7999948.1 M20/M25/M40 family metallo-hydrolase [Candidatus Nitrosocaldus sp.]MDW8275409.1 M20/M25/M40 family metallo-hydrolase [Candidatus Nitrosocaldus sp.]